MTRFSVIIPTYNRGGLIRETIETVLAQTYPHYEILVVDDGSTDHTASVITQHFSDQEKLRYLKKENGERGAARNYGLAAAAGDYAVFFDSDDLMKPGYLQTLATVIDAHPGIFFLAAKYNFRLPDGKERPAPIAGIKEGWYDRNFFLKGNILAANYCIRIHDKQYKEFPPDRTLASMEDWLFILLNTEKERVYIHDEVALSMRQHEERSMGDNQKVIRARNLATDWVLSRVSLSKAEQQLLKAWSHYFCGIHQYLDYKRWAAVREAGNAIALAGINRKFLILLAKSLLGRKIILRIR